MFDSLVDLISGSAWSYGFILGIAALDAIFPLVPSETAVITAGVLAASGDLNIGLIILSAAVGAIIGDNVMYLLGRTAGERISGRLFRGDRKRHLERAERTLDERGGYLIVIARFIPGGRTATTFACGTLRMLWPRFIAFDSLAGCLWGAYAGLIGYFGGKAFEDSPMKGILVALGIAFAIAAGVEVIRWYRRRSRRGGPRPDPVSESADRS